MRRVSSPIGSCGAFGLSRWMGCESFRTQGMETQTWKHGRGSRSVACPPSPRASPSCCAVALTNSVALADIAGASLASESVVVPSVASPSASPRATPTATLEVPLRPTPKSSKRPHRCVVAPPLAIARRRPGRAGEPAPRRMRRARPGGRHRGRDRGGEGVGLLGRAAGLGAAHGWSTARIDAARVATGARSGSRHQLGVRAAPRSPSARARPADHRSGGGSTPSGVRPPDRSATR